MDKKENRKQIKINKQKNGKKKVPKNTKTLLIILIISLIALTSYGYYYYNYVYCYECNIERLAEEYRENLKNEKEKIEKLKKYIQDRDEMAVNIIKNKSKITELKQVSRKEAISYIKKNEDKFGKVEIKNGKEIILANEKLLITDYYIQNNKLVEVVEEEKTGYPTISFTERHIIDKAGNIIAKTNSQGKIEFSLLKNNSGDYVVKAQDLKDGDITDKIKIEVEGGETNPQKWIPGNTYKIKYSVKNSLGNETVKEINIKTIKLQISR